MAKQMIFETAKDALEFSIKMWSYISETGETDKAFAVRQCGQQYLLMNNCSLCEFVAGLLPEDCFPLISDSCEDHCPSYQEFKEVLVGEPNSFYCMCEQVGSPYHKYVNADNINTVKIAANDMVKLLAKTRMRMGISIL